MPIVKQSLENNNLSATKQTRNLEVGEFIYIECDSITQAHNVSKRLSLSDRLPREMKHYKFDCCVYTNIALQGGAIVYLNKVTRTA